MNTELFKILALLILVAVITVLIKQNKPELAIVLSLSATVAVLLYILPLVYPSISKIRDLFMRGSSVSVYFGYALKALGIAYISGFAADTCRDFGQNSLAAKAELAGKCAIFVLCVPLMSSVLEIALRFAGL